MSTTNGDILAATKMNVMSHSARNYQYFKALVDRVMTHDQYETLIKMYYWRWILEQLVVATARPKMVTKKYKSALNPHVHLLNPDHRNPIFSYNVSESITFVAGSTFFYINDAATDSHWIVSRDHLLQLADTATQRHLTFTTSIFAEILEDQSVPLPYVLLSVFSWGDDIISRFGNESYRSIKLWEPLLTAYMLNFHADPHVDQATFWNMITREFIHSQGAVNERWMTVHLGHLNAILEPYAHGNSDILSQLFGLYRIWGHPTVDGLQGIRK